MRVRACSEKAKWLKAKIDRPTDRVCSIRPFSPQLGMSAAMFSGPWSSPAHANSPLLLGCVSHITEEVCDGINTENPSLHAPPPPFTRIQNVLFNFIESFFVTRFWRERKRARAAGGRNGEWSRWGTRVDSTHTLRLCWGVCVTLGWWMGSGFWSYLVQYYMVTYSTTSLRSNMSSVDGWVSEWVVWMDGWAGGLIRIAHPTELRNWVWGCNPFLNFRTSVIELTSRPQFEVWYRCLFLFYLHFLSH